MPQLGDIGHLIQLAVAPVFLLAGVGGILSLLSLRQGRGIVDRAREIQRLRQAPDATANDTHIAELDVLAKRGRLVHAAYTLTTATGVLVCMVVAALFVGDAWLLARLVWSEIVAALFILAMLCLTAALLCMLSEILLAATEIKSATRRDHPK